MRPIQKHFGAALVIATAVAAATASSTGCELISTVDRSQIPDNLGSGGATNQGGGGASQGGGGASNQGGGGSNQGGGGSNQGGGGSNQGGGGSGGGATCTDGTTNGNETGVDCGGGTCPDCPTGQPCNANTDCLSDRCTVNVCQDGLVISEIRSRGPGGADDEFIELYNPTSLAVTTDSTWHVIRRDAPGTGPCGNNADATLWIGSGQVVLPHHYLLIGGSAYAGANAADSTATASFIDGASVRLEHNAAVVDAVCFYADQNSQDDLTTCTIAYVCEGAPIMNTHNNSMTTNNDTSIERKPGNVNGNGTDTNVTSADFQAAGPSLPQNLNSQAP